MKKTQQLLFCSLIINLMFFGLSGILVYRRIVTHYFNSKAAPTSFIDSPLYLDIKTTYSKMPRKDTELIFAGDSITHFCPWSELLQRPVLNRGITGDSVEGLRRRINEVLQHAPRQLFIMIGINDLMYGDKTSSQVLAEYRLLIEEIKKTSPHTKIFLQSILPINTFLLRDTWEPELLSKVTQYILQINKSLADIADGKQVVYVDLYSKMVAEKNQLNKQYTFDGIHLNGTGYLKWRDVVHLYLE